LLEARGVQSCWLEHLSGRRDHSRPLWAVLMLQSWLDTQVEQQASESADLLEPAH
jgi:asparagine synthase (glutamine-hydrolysing)